MAGAPAVRQPYGRGRQAPGCTTPSTRGVPASPRSAAAAAAATESARCIPAAAAAAGRVLVAHAPAAPPPAPPPHKVAQLARRGGRRRRLAEPAPVDRVRPAVGVRPARHLHLPGACAAAQHFPLLICFTLLDTVLIATQHSQQL